ncbi:hypothetical protein [Pimelobacter simplex]|uniref:hypothetical protein n=1 Tax=Nocardioides simplex TaxID=2045 RepID=UPI00215049AF|nr:hypothetical protein [Pimelobacter simplex]UUW88356.1 hypothetical protein M0M43_21790 [Pimelobacter simplex]UUW97860.1 hypothetical protein M0M48_10435 [Pimelobacter simplex]
MTRVVIDTPISEETAAAIATGWAEYRAATEANGPSDEWDNRVINQVIRHLVRQGRPFSANTMRPLLPDVRKALISRRLIDAQRAGWVRYVGVTPSTLKSTKAARVNVYAPIPGALDD